MKKKDISRAALLAVEQDERVKAEYQLIEAEFAGCPEWPLLSPLAARAAFLGVMIAELELDILQNGVDEPYSNGGGQAGRKKRASTDLVTAYTKLYAGIMGQLGKELSKGKPVEAEEDELVKFLRRDEAPAKRSWGEADELDEFERF